jgi:glycosidase
MQAMRRFFAFRESTAGELDAFLRRHLAFFGDGLALPTFLDNHDMNRFLWVVGGDTRRLRLAAMCQFALPGPPIVYYGTELGLSQRRDVRYADGSGHPEESRLPMPWGEAADPSLLAFYAALGGLRRATAGLWRRPREVVALDDETGLYAWRCDDAAAGAMVALNNGAGEVEVPMDEAAGWDLALATADGVRLAAGRLALPPVAGAILVRGVKPFTETAARRIEAR